MNVLVEEQNLQDIASAIRNKNKSENTYRPSEMAQAIEEISTGSIDDSIYQYATTLKFTNAKLPTVVDVNIPDSIKSLYEIFYQCSGGQEITVHSTTAITNMQKAFCQCGSSKKITIDFDTSKVSNWGDAFSCNWDGNGANEIIGNLDFSSATAVGFIFGYCTKLKEIRIVPETLKLSLDLSYCGQLSDESVQSVINGLSDLSESTAKTITFTTAVKDKLTEEQIATINSKGWTLA